MFSTIFKKSFQRGKEIEAELEEIVHAKVLEAIAFTDKTFHTLVDDHGAHNLDFILKRLDELLLEFVSLSELPQDYHDFLYEMSNKYLYQEVMEPA